jgi:hypothetical protein
MLGACLVWLAALQVLVVGTARAAASEPAQSAQQAPIGDGQTPAAVPGEAPARAPLTTTG